MNTFITCSVHDYRTEMESSLQDEKCKCKTLPNNQPRRESIVAFEFDTSTAATLFVPVYRHVLRFANEMLQPCACCPQGLSEPLGALLALVVLKPFLTVDRLQYMLACVGGLMVGCHGVGIE